MKINFEKTDNLNAVLELNIEKSDYEASFNDELKSYRKKAALKGFRKGKAPISFIKKMYGKAILAEKINKTLQDNLFKYLQDEKIEILGDPLPNAGQEQIDFDENNLEDYSFKFDLGLSPEFEVAGISDTDSYERSKVKVSDDMIEEELTAFRKRMGSMKSVEGKVEDKDLVSLQAEELDGDKTKENGWASEFSVSVDLVAEDYKKEIIGLAKGDTFDFDIYKLEDNKEADYVEKYLIQNEDEDVEIGNMFRGKVAEIKRMELAELNKELFDKAFGPGEVKSEEDMRKKIEDNIGNFYSAQCESLLYRQMMDNLVKSNTVDLPDTFLKRWLVESNEKHTAEQIDEDFPKFKENLIWTLVKTRLSKAYEVEVKPEEIQEQLAKTVQGYFGGQVTANDPYFAQIMQQVMQDKQQVQNAYNEVESTKVFKAMAKNVKITEKEISLDDYKEMVEAVNKQYQK